MYDLLTSVELYLFLKGPMVWIAFLIFIGGIILRIASLLYRAKKARVIYPYLNVRYTIRSIFHWIVPFGSTNMRKRPWITIITFLFHTCLILCPIFLLAHIMLWHESWNIRWWALPEGAADAATLIVILGGLFFVIRRLIAGEVRSVTSASDFLILGIALAPYITGYLAFHHYLFEYDMIITLHILFGELLLILIPFTRLSHMFLFWFTRAYTGSEFGEVRHSRDY
jgi:nitrate reductase gamma subunit